MRDDLKTILGGVAQFIVGILIAAAAVGLYVFSYSHPMPEESWIEVGQETFLLLSAIIMALAARADGRYAGGLWLISGFLTALFIRELDAWFDLIFHGSWKYFLIAYLCVLAFLVKKASLKTVVPGLAHFIRSRAFPLMLVGTVIVLAYSRLYGYKGMWALYAGDCSWNGIKTVSEEATELVGYALMFYSAWIYKRLK